MFNASDAGAASSILKSMTDEQRRLFADSSFAVTAVLRGKTYELHDERSESLSGAQLRILQETALSLRRSLTNEIVELEKALLAYCNPPGQECGEFDVNAVSDADCRAALVLAVNLACRFRTAFEVERTFHAYDGMRIEAFNEKWDQIFEEMTELDSHAAEIAADNLRLREELRSVKAAYDALKERVHSCSALLAKDRRIQPPRKGKKQLDTVAELERSIAVAISQFDATQKKCDALTRDLNHAKRALANTEQKLCAVAELKRRLRETTDDCSAKADEIEALSSKLRCSICEERDKDTAFACGHTFCADCATACAKCPLRCESERRHKPVKHTFRLYF